MSHKYYGQPNAQQQLIALPTTSLNSLCKCQLRDKKYFFDHTVLKIDSFHVSLDADFLNVWIKLSLEYHK